MREKESARFNLSLNQRERERESLREREILFPSICLLEALSRSKVRYKQRSSPDSVEERRKEGHNNQSD